MGDPDAFLTDERRAVLTGEYDGTESVRRTHQSRIRARARSAIQELTEVAQSPHIDNRDIFDPEEIGTLLFYILRDPRQVDPSAGGLVEPSEETQQYRDAILAQLWKQIAKYGEFDAGRLDDPPEGPEP